MDEVNATKQIMQEEIKEMIEKRKRDKKQLKLLRTKYINLKTAQKDSQTLFNTNNMVNNTNVNNVTDTNNVTSFQFSDGTENKENQPPQMCTHHFFFIIF